MANLSIFSLSRLVVAYRKAKTDLFYTSLPRRLDLVAYESNLRQNLSLLSARLRNHTRGWINDDEFLGSFTFIPKSLAQPQVPKRSYWSEPAQLWKNSIKESETKPAANFRLMSLCSIDMHILSTLWMLEVGSKLDARLTHSAYGSRLRRGPRGGSNLLGVGSFQHYQSAYQAWKEDGLDAVQANLRANKKVIALTADAASFYHNLDCAFLRDTSFLSVALDARLSDQQYHLHNLFVDALEAWAYKATSWANWAPRGLPVGLPASAVVANLALIELDAAIENLDPLFYGRYVDDLFLAVEDPGDILDQRELWTWLIKKAGSMLERTEVDSEVVRFAPSYLESSDVLFKNAKNKSFHLSGASGLAVLESLRKNIEESSSEWRSLGALPNGTDKIDLAVARAQKANGTPALTLRDMDEMSSRKQMFSIQLRDIEAYERNLESHEWHRNRNAFVSSVCEFIFTLPTIFEMYGYIPRVLTVLAATGDIDALLRIVDVSLEVIRTVEETCALTVAGYAEGLQFTDATGASVLDKWTQNLRKHMFESIAAGWRLPDTSETLEVVRLLVDDKQDQFLQETDLFDTHSRLAERDLAHRPYRWSFLQMPLGESNLRPVSIALPLGRSIKDGIEALSELLGREVAIGRGVDVGLVLATRPVKLTDLYLSTGNRWETFHPLLVKRALRAFRGQFTTGPAKATEDRNGRRTISIETLHRSIVRIAFTMLDVQQEDMLAAAGGDPNLTFERFYKFSEFFDKVRTHKPRPAYILMPELAMPANWFHHFATGLSRSGISLISGIEHQLVSHESVCNQVWASLLIQGWGREYFTYVQDKQRAAPPEASLLASVGKTLKPEFSAIHPAVIRHDNLQFSVLVCSEFTNITHRANLAGRVDAVLVPEWNRDLHTFEALVEAAALDLHAYIGQSNVRGYGDSRLRAPMRDEWARDVVRLKGGDHNYFVVGELDIESLRQFQSKSLSSQTSLPPDRDEFTDPRGSALPCFKPLPDGFALDPTRKP